MLDEATLRCKSQLLSTCGSLGVFDPSNPEIWYESRFHRTVESEANLLGGGLHRQWNRDGRPLSGSGGLALGFCRNPPAKWRHLWHRKLAGALPRRRLGTKRTSGALTRRQTAYGGAEMVYYEPDNGGAVISVGSITYVASLLIDLIVSRITSNVINRFLSGR